MIFQNHKYKKRDPSGSLDFKIFNCYVTIALYLVN